MTENKETFSTESSSSLDRSGGGNGGTPGGSLFGNKEVADVVDE